MFGAAWEPKPVVLLLGWLGAKARYFDKYVELWRQLGAQPIGIRPTILQTAIPPLANRALLAFMADVNRLYGNHVLLHGATQPLFVHTFSNAGWLAFGTMLHLASLLQSHPLAPVGASAGLQPFGFQGDAPAASAERSPSTLATTQPWKLNPRAQEAEARHPLLQDPVALATLVAFRQTLRQASGIVIDSAPSQASPYIWTRGLLSAALGQATTSIDASYPWAVRPLLSLTRAYLRSGPVARRYSEVQQAWLEESPTCPQLYLFSEADALIPADDVRAFIHKQRDRGVSVQSRCWPDSHHCEHYRQHPQEYTHLVRTFMENCALRSGAGWRGLPAAAGVEREAVRRW